MEIIAVLQKDVCRLCFNLSVHFSFYFIIKIKKNCSRNTNSIYSAAKINRFERF